MVSAAVAALLGAVRSAVMGETGTEWRDAPLTGRVDAIADALLAVPSRQMIVLGDAGAGKSVLTLLMTSQLLDRGNLDPVPRAVEGDEAASRELGD